MITTRHVPNQKGYRQNRQLRFDTAYWAKKFRLAVWDYIRESCPAGVAREYYGGNILIGGTEYSKVVDFLVLHGCQYNPSILSVIRNFKDHITEDLFFVDQEGAVDYAV